MPKPSWEASNNNWAYGYLKFLDFQTDGFDLHVTFQKDKKVHASVYEKDKADTKVSANLWMTVQTYGLTITDANMELIKAATGSKNLPTVTGYSTYKDFLLENSNAKAVELGIIAQKPAPKPTFTLDLDKDFPPLG
jgi:hypothetical protein